MENEIYTVSEKELSTTLSGWLMPIIEQMERDSISLDCKLVLTIVF